MEGNTALAWIWLAVAVAAGVGEILTAGLFLLPFAIGALLAAVLGFLDLGIAWQLLAFVVGTAGSFAALRPLAARLDRSGVTDGIGSRRLVGQQAVVLEEIPSGAAGMVRIGGEEWRAESADGDALPTGTTVRVIDVQGTRAIVERSELDDQASPAH